MSWRARRRFRPLPSCFLSILLFLYALGAATAEGVTCLVDSTTGNDLNACCATANPCLTIQAAVNKATGGDTISVAAGTYPESAAGPLAINKTLTLWGAQHGVDARTRVGMESIVTDSQGTSVSASDVVIDGFTIQDSTNVAYTGYGIWLNPNVSGTQIVNNIFQMNIIGLGISNTGPSQLLIRHNLFQNNNQPGGGASGTGIYTDQYISQGAVTNVLIEENVFKANNNSGIDLSNTDVMQGVSNIEVRNNSFDVNGRAFNIFNTHMLTFHDNSVTNCTLAGSAALRIFDFNSDVTIVNNDLVGGVGHGIRLSDLAEIALGPSSTVRINFNNIVPFDLDGLLVDPASHVGTVDAECNWWGSDTGPTNAGNPGGTGETVVGDADFKPWFIGPAPEGPCGLPQGDQCTDSSECQGGLFCADGVCCNALCNEPNASCVVPGQVGFCVQPQIVPATSWPTQVAIVALLLLIGGFGARTARRRTEG